MPFAEKLRELNIQQEGTTILAITRKIAGKESMILPDGDTAIQEDDLLTVYGRDAAMNCLFMRPVGGKGDEVHQLRVEQQNAIKKLGNTEEELSPV